MIATVMDVVWDTEPLVPLTLTEYVPSAADEDAVNWIIELADPPEGGVTGFVEKVAPRVDGVPPAFSVTALENPFNEVTVTVAYNELPCTTATLEGKTANEKSWGGVDRIFNVNDV